MPEYNAEAVAEMRTQLGRWGVSLNPSEDVVAKFFETLRFQSNPPLTNPVHPDEVFAARFANMPPGPQAPEQLNASLEAALRHLGVQPAAGASSRELVQAVSRAAASTTLVESRHLRGGRVGTGQNIAFQFPADAPAANQAASQFAFRLQGGGEPASSDVTGAARRAVQQLNRWGVAGVSADDAQRRPAYVFRVYTHFLSSHHAGTDNTGNHMDFDAGFVRQLPREPVAAHQELNNDASVRAALRTLGEQLGSERAVFLNSMVSSIGDSLNYPEWVNRVRPSERFESNPAGLDISVIMFADRFRRDADSAPSPRRTDPVPSADPTLPVAPPRQSALPTGITDMLGNNVGLLAGGAIGLVATFLSGGSLGWIGYLLPLVGAGIGIAIDGSRGVAGGLFGSMNAAGRDPNQGSRTVAAHAPALSNPLQPETATYAQVTPAILHDARMSTTQSTGITGGITVTTNTAPAHTSRPRMDATPGGITPV